MKTSRIRTAGPPRPARWFLVLLLFTSGFTVGIRAAPSWPEALRQMPLRSRALQLNRTNCVQIMLDSFQSNSVVKALIFMPGATDEFYMFRRARADLTNSTLTLFDAVAALTNQTLIRVTFRPPLLLLHTDEDPLDPQVKIEHPATVARLREARFLPHAAFNDRDWDFVEPLLEHHLKVSVYPWRHMYISGHFYRHSLAAWGLDGWETLETIALAGKTGFTVRRKKVLFELDERVRATPKFDVFPR